METITFQQQRRRSVLLVLPLVVFALTTALFHLLGGGQASSENRVDHHPQGLNTHLPDARLKDEQNMNKLSYYNRAATDSATLKQAARTDPYAKKQADTATGPLFLSPSPFYAQQSHISGMDDVKGGNDSQARDVMINKRLSELQAMIDKPAVPQATYTKTRRAAAFSLTASPGGLTVNHEGNSLPATKDPELQQMDGLLEKILDIQHPERVKDKNTSTATAVPPDPFQAIPAVIDGNQKIIQGTVIRIRLKDSIRLNGHLFPKGQLIYGAGDLYNQRVKVNIRQIPIGLNIIPVNLTVYDRTDGMEGINVPEAVTGDALREGEVNGMQTVDMMNQDPSVTAQLTTAGINTAKGLFSKKIKRVKGKLSNGHELLLKNNLLSKQ